MQSTILPCKITSGQQWVFTPVFCAKSFEASMTTKSSEWSALFFLEEFHGVTHLASSNSWRCRYLCFEW